LAKPHTDKPFARAGTRIGARDARGLKPDGDVLKRCLPGKQRIGLEQVAGGTIG
jgi:hypothetical protein